MARTPMSLGQHFLLGRRLRDVHEMLVKNGVDVSNRYGPSGRGKSARAGRLLLDVSQALSKAICELDEQLLRDHGADNFCAHIYYPGPIEDRMRHVCATCTRALEEVEAMTDKEKERVG